MAAAGPLPTGRNARALAAALSALPGWASFIALINVDDWWIRSMTVDALMLAMLVSAVQAIAFGVAAERRCGADPNYTCSDWAMLGIVLGVVLLVLFVFCEGAVQTSPDSID